MLCEIIVSNEKRQSIVIHCHGTNIDSVMHAMRNSPVGLMMCEEQLVHIAETVLKSGEHSHQGISYRINFV